MTSRHTRPGASISPDGPEQVQRLRRYREANPGVVIVAGTGFWQARSREADTETVITRFTLRDLLDKLQEGTRELTAGNA
jgi:hypothetical protein